MSINKYRFTRPDNSESNIKLINEEVNAIFKLVQDAAANKEIDIMLALKITTRLESLRNISIESIKYK